MKLRRHGIVTLAFVISLPCAPLGAQVARPPLDRPSERPLPLPEAVPERRAPVIELPPLEIPPAETQTVSRTACTRQ